MTAGRQATRTDVARLAETSVAVVSYVVNDGPRSVSAKRRQRVLDAMKELNYQPNAIARSLTSTRTNTIGMIVPNINNSFFAELALAVEVAATRVGRLLFLGNSNEESGREAAYVQSFLRQRVDAVIIIGVAQNASIRELISAKVPTVVLDRGQGEEGVANVGIDHEEAGRLATEHLAWHGHRRIACLTGPEGLQVAEDRLRGWREIVSAPGFDADAPVYRSSFSLEGGKEAMLALLRDAPDITALFVASDEQARGVLAAASNAGVVVPARLAVVSVDGTRQSAFASPPLSTVRQPLDELAEAAVATAVDPKHSQSLLMHAMLQASASCGCQPD